MIRKIEIDFALPVDLTDEEMYRLDHFVDSIARRYQPEGWLHWAAGSGSKPHFSAVDCGILGKALDPEGPPNGAEPTFDDEVLYIETAAREAYPEELQRKRWRDDLRTWHRLPWWKRCFTQRPIWPATEPRP